MYALALQATNDGLTLTEVLVDIPHDFGALVVYLMLGLFVFFIWYGSRSGVAERHGMEYETGEPEANAVDDQAGGRAGAGGGDGRNGDPGPPCEVSAETPEYGPGTHQLDRVIRR